jgi:hypothetical protein
MNIFEKDVSEVFKIASGPIRSQFTLMLTIYSFDYNIAIIDHEVVVGP